MLEVERTTENDKYLVVEYLGSPDMLEVEHREEIYRIIRLQNGLTALLIGKEEANNDMNDKDYSDEEDNSPVKQVNKDVWKAYCGLCVRVGSFNDPPEIPGLAHLLEHMFFMGSKKYPKENDFNEFISNYGGSTDSVTDCEYTRFYFDIEQKQLLSALDRFVQFFIEPLMKKDVIMREREAVESEFQLAIPYDENRKEQLLSSIARTGHPPNKFVWGNLITLHNNIDDDKLYEELHKFRKRHYSANRMTLAIKANLSIDTLARYVANYFADILNNGLPPDDFTEFRDGISFDTPAFRKIYKVKPFSDISQLHVTWALPSLLNLYKSKPHKYISWIIEHKGKGSLTSYLRKKMWSFDLFCGNYDNDNGFGYNSMYVLFDLIVELSYEGQQHLEEVLDAMFSFIKLLKRNGPQERIYKEIYKIVKDNFRFNGKFDHMFDLCKSMHIYPPCDYIFGNSELYFEYNPEAIQKCLDFLMPETANIMIFNYDFDCQELNKVEPWFKIKYTDIEIPKEWIERWKSIEPLPDFHLPLCNVFLTNNFSSMSVLAEVSKYPVRLHVDHISEIWYCPNFYSSKCYINFHFISSSELQSPRNAALQEMYCNILKYLSLEELYPAIMAGFDYKFDVSKEGITVKINGFIEKLPTLLMVIAKYIVDCLTLISKDLFEIVKVRQLKAYYNKFIDPEKLIEDVELWIINHGYYTHVDMYNALRSINFEEFRDFVKSFTNHLYIQCLVQGNITKDLTIEIIQRFMEKINYSPLLRSSTSQMGVTQIPLGTSYCKLKNINQIDLNSVVTNYYQVGFNSIELSVLIDLMLTIMEEPLMYQLRTQEQLSYDIFCDLRDTNGILGYSITVHTQADKYTTEYVDERIEEFLKSFNKILEKFTEKKLNDVKERMRILKQIDDVKNLNDKVKRNWNEITKKEYMFDRCEKEAFAIDNININKLRKFALDASYFRKLSVHVVGNDPMKSAVKESNNAENRKKAEYSILEYIIDDQHKNTKDHYITNIEDYKKSFFASIYST